MKTILETDRLTLREFSLQDIEPFFRMVSDPDVTRYTGSSAQTLEEARQVLEERTLADYRKYGYGRWAAVYKPIAQVIGFAGLKYLDDLGEADLGYRFFKEHWGMGLATEAARAVLAYGFGTLGLKRIIAFADQENQASVRVLEKVGFTFEKFSKYRDLEVAWYVLEAQTWKHGR
jgi:RimJ/RimL family protein N-acetyltransferase